MAQNLDLNLPSVAPDDYISRYDTGNLLPAALYTLVDLPETELREAARICETEIYGMKESDAGTSVRPAPQPRFVSQPLRDVYNTHIELAPREEYDPLYFIVITDGKWRETGVLLVGLYEPMEDGGDEHGIQSLVCRAEAVGSIFVNLQIANTDWHEVKEQVEYEWEEKRDNPSDDDTDRFEPPTGADQGQSEDEGPDYPSKKPAVDYLIPIYILDSVNADALVHSLEENIHQKPNPHTDYEIRTQASLTPNVAREIDTKTLDKPNPTITADLIAQACALHPVRCRANKWLHKTLILLCDTTATASAGLVLIRLTWDAITQGRSKSALKEIGAAAPREAVRIPGDSEMGITYGYKAVANGISILARDHDAFGLFILNSQFEHLDASVVERGRNDKKCGDEYFVLPPTEVNLPGTGTEETETITVSWTLEEAVKRFPWFCHDARLQPRLSRRYFVWFDMHTVKKEGAVLVRYRWDADIERDARELWEFNREEADVSVLRVPAKRVMAKACAMAEKDVDDPGAGDEEGWMSYVPGWNPNGCLYYTEKLRMQNRQLILATSKQKVADLMQVLQSNCRFHKTTFFEQSKS
ncbi:hypothetical protein DM02DRAFT_724885 [Periconia macrospinosa]|uniref:Uncharacterized protein n=1 Tax=Periconia macrospinosa TaxID=97972 RepID=A0A2V1E604_9PLEO|nr:hypothetical protein DM02DRAFT_724885 [Periconia macrospinosa]